MTANTKINTRHDSNVESIGDDVNDENSVIFLFFSCAAGLELAQSFTKGQGSPYMFADEYRLVGVVDA
jgi:hypothetical protein